MKVEHEGQQVNLKELARANRRVLRDSAEPQEPRPAAARQPPREGFDLHLAVASGNGERWEALYQRDHARQMMVHGYVVIYRGCRVNDRLGRVAFMSAKCQQRMAQLVEEAECFAPDDDLPEALQRECQRWDHLRDFARRQLAAASEHWRRRSMFSGPSERGHGLPLAPVSLTPFLRRVASVLRTVAAVGETLKLGESQENTTTRRALAREEKKMDNEVHEQQPVDDHYGGRVFLNVRQTAALLGISERLLDGLVRNGEIPSALIGRRRVFVTRGRCRMGARSLRCESQCGCALGR